MASPQFSLRDILNNPAVWLRLAVIAVSLIAASALFAWAGGWLTPQRLSPDRLVNALEKTGGVHPGYRRNHAKGLCVAGYFESNGNAGTLSRAFVFAPGRTPVVGRFAIAGGNPGAPDGNVPVRSMALSLKNAAGQEWRTGMNALPFFPVATPQGFYDQQVASRPDPATGKPDPAKMRDFLSAHPEARAFAAWAGQYTPSSSWSNIGYNSLNAFRFIDPAGQSRFVRWGMVPHTPWQGITAAEKADSDFLQHDLKQRLAQGPLKWDLIVTVAAQGDVTNDASKAWPDDRQKINAGTLVLTSAQDQAQGKCRDINYDPLILPDGISASDDPLLSARSAAYSTSFNRRTHEEAQEQRHE